MELIIKIPDKVYNRIKSDNGHGYCTLRDQDERVIVNAICNSTPLPKGHGDLIDRDKLSPQTYGAKAIWGAVLKAPVIVDADKESNEGAQ